MQAVIDTKDALEHLCIDIQTFQEKTLPRAIYHAPIIDHFHPDNYSQRGIAGLSKFRDSVEAEIGFAQGIIHSGAAPKEFTTNAPNLLAVWAEFSRARWPIVSIGLYARGASKGQTKIDIVADGGNEWIKVNTIKAQRLLAEFREQDSYINSDYDSDSSIGSDHRQGSLSNSIITQARRLVATAKAERRSVDLPSPRIRLILNRITEGEQVSYGDDRIPATFQAIRDLGVDLVLGSERPFPVHDIAPICIVPSCHILLDLSVVIALCCDSTHHPLPTSQAELESRFRQLTRYQDGVYELEPHINVTKDLRNQLEWEWSHPLIEELDDRLADAGYRPEELQFWVTQEVRERLPGIVDVIGGPGEKTRAKALFGETNMSFWARSRYEGKTKVLDEIRVRVLPQATTEDPSSSNGHNSATFEWGLIHACRSMLNDTEKVDGMKEWEPPRKSRNPKRIDTQFPPTTRTPSAHTLRTMLAGVQSRMTVLTNNRGAVGKLVRDMGVYAGYPGSPTQHGSRANDRRSAIWVVNPSSLCEWRRLQVEEQNTQLHTGQDMVQNC